MKYFLRTIDGLDVVRTVNIPYDSYAEAHEALVNRIYLNALDMVQERVFIEAMRSTPIMARAS